MNVRCQECERGYDDARCWTICPHNPLYRGADERVCAEFHTHPNPPVDENSTVWAQGPSQSDVDAANAAKIPGIVRNAAGTETYGDFDPAP